MAGGLMQLVAYGAQDVYLTGNPQITYFKVVYRRHTNFSIEAIEMPVFGNADFGRKPNVLIQRNGDLVTRMYLMVTLNSVHLSCGSKFAWVRKLGHALLTSVEVQIGGSQIDKQYGVWLDIWYELARHAGDGERGFAKMIGDVPELTRYDEHEKPEYKLYIPLKFWFNRHAGLALPLIALQYHEVRIQFEFAPVHQLYISNDHFKYHDSRCLTMKDAVLLVDYIYLDSEERRRFAQVGHEYLVELLQFTGDVTANQLSSFYKLDFNHPVKELVWVVKFGKYHNGKKFVFYTHKNNWEDELVNASEKILRESLCLLTVNESQGSSGETCSVIDDEKRPESGEWEEFCPNLSSYTTNGQIFVNNSSCEKALWVNTNSLKVKEYKITDKISADVFVPQNAQTVDDVKITNIKTGVTVRDLSFDHDQLCDTRYNPDDPCVYQPFNYGVLIDRTGNPVRDVLLQLNGHDRFDRRNGDYFNYVQPDQHHTNTPSDGINVYSFALHPEQHQPSGTANLSRIDTTRLNINYHDPTFVPGLPKFDICCTDDQLSTFAHSYNVLRIISGMGGLAYAN